MTRIANVSRKTSETDITIKMNLDGVGKYDIETGVNFFNHMLESFSKHSMIDLDVKAEGDIEIDDLAVAFYYFIHGCPPVVVI